MATLHVENVPNDLYEALRKRARRNRTSHFGRGNRLIAPICPDTGRIEASPEVLQVRASDGETQAFGPRSFSFAEKMLREDRER